MLSTIAELWNGNLEPILHLGENNSELKKTEGIMCRNYQKLEDALNDDLKPLLVKYFDSINDYVIAMSEHAFCDGFSLGSRISAESFLGAENLRGNSL